MIQIEHLLAVTEVINKQVTAEARAPRKESSLTAEEQTASHAEREKVMQLLNEALAQTESIKTQFADDASTQVSPDSVSARTAEVAEVAAANAPSDPKSIAGSITDGLTAKDPKGLNDQTMSLKQMTEAAGPILDTFKAILDRKGLENYNASLNTAPVVGFKGENVVYIQTKSNRLPTGNVTNDSWAVFDKVPAGFDASNGSTHFFPYEGHLYVANGTKLWVRRCRPKGDPDFNQQACNNWPKMYYDTWEFLGDKALPANNLADIVPWATLSADSSVVKFRLVALTAEGELQVFQQESLTASNTFGTMTYKAKDKKSPSSAPSWSRVAYNNNKFVGYDRDYNLWDIIPDFTDNSYTVENKYAQGQADTFSEYTANDIGLVVAKKDGFLWKRIASTVDTSDAPKDGTDTPVDETKWIRWIALDGVKNIGVASPGIILDLLTLTESLKTRYLETQATLWPVVNTIKTFAGTHRVFLNQVNQAAKDFDSADDLTKQKKALRVGKSAVGHAKAWAGILTKTVTKAQEPVTAMAKQLRGVYRDLVQQIGLLNVKLTELKNRLKEEEKALSAAQVGFWVGIGTLLLGVVGVIAGLATGNVWLVAGGGMLFVGGLIAASVSGSKAAKASAAVSKTKSDIALVETAIRELTAVTDQFAEIDRMYSVLDKFWGRMLGHAISIGTSDQAMLETIGMSLLIEDSASYEYAMEMTKNLEDGAQAYQDLISAQGIKIPLPIDDDDEEEDDDAAVASLGAGTATAVYQYVQPLVVEKFTQQAAYAQYALEQGNDDDYEILMQKALQTQEASIASISDSGMLSGAWFDVDTLKGTAGVFLTTTIQAQLNVIRDSVPDAVVSGLRAIGNLVQSRKNVEQSLQATIQLATLMSTWSDDPFDDDSDKHREQIEKYKRPALSFCNLARDGATIANNSFAEVNHMAQNHSHEVNRKISELQQWQRIVDERMDSELRDIDVPFPLQLFGSQEKIMGWVQARAAEVAAKYQVMSDAYENEIKKHEASLVSWSTFHNHALSWVELCQTISRNLASIQGLLDSLGKELKVDALLYKKLMEQQWHKLLDNAREILSLIGFSAGSEEQVLRTILGMGTGIFLNGSAALMSIEADTSPKALLKATLSPDKHLAKHLRNCTSTTAAFFATVSDLGSLPFAADINSGLSSKAPKSLLEVVADLRNQYSNLSADNFTAVSKIKAAAGVQQILYKKKAASVRRLDMIIQQQLIYVEFAHKAALGCSDAWAAASDDYARTCSTIKNNVAIYKALIKDLDAAAAKKQKELDDYIAGIAADAIACCMISIGLGFGIAFGGAAGLSAVAKKAWMVIGKVGTVYDKQGLGWKDAFKTWYKDLDIGDQAATIANLRSLSKILDEASEKLNTASDHFRDAVMAGKDEALAVSRMHARLVDASSKIQVLKSVELDESDIEEIVYLWDEVEDASEVWMDEFSGQGISPILHQFDNDIEEVEQVV